MVLSIQCICNIWYKALIIDTIKFIMVEYINKQYNK